MDGMLLAAAVCADRSAYNEIKRVGVKLDSLPEAAAAIIRAADEQYRRDPACTRISQDVLSAQVTRRYGDNDVARSIMDFARRFPDDASGINIADEWRLLRLREVETSIAGLLATGQTGDELDELLDRRRELKDRSGGQDSSESFRLGIEDFMEDKAARIPLSPSALNEYIGGGVLRGHNVVIYGRPDSGKSMLALDNAAFLVAKGYKVLYVANEEPAQDITRRLLSNLCDIDIDELRDLNALSEALEYAEEDYANWYLYHKAGVTSKDISALAEKLKPDVIVVDQLKNVAVSEDNRALQLDKLAREVRELGIEHGCVTVSVTQAGESGHNQLVLGLGDVEWSNTGIPGAADLMVGVGVDPNYDRENKRMLSVPKNKANGKHGAFPVWINPKRTMFMSKRKA